MCDTATHSKRFTYNIIPRRQLQHDGKCRDGFIGMLESGMEKCEMAPVLQMGYSDQVFEVRIDNEPICRDDLTGQTLDLVLVKAARKKELDFFEAKGVWVKKAVDEARRKTGKPPITVRWVDVKKADDIEPNWRVRTSTASTSRSGPCVASEDVDIRHRYRQVILQCQHGRGRGPHLRHAPTRS